jgi:hypothetical protein
MAMDCGFGNVDGALRGTQRGVTYVKSSFSVPAQVDRVAGYWGDARYFVWPRWLGRRRSVKRKRNSEQTESEVTLKGSAGKAVSSGEEA